MRAVGNNATAAASPSLSSTALARQCPDNHLHGRQHPPTCRLHSRICPDHSHRIYFSQAARRGEARWPSQSNTGIRGEGNDLADHCTDCASSNWPASARSLCRYDAGRPWRGIRVERPGAGRLPVIRRCALQFDYARFEIGRGAAELRALCKSADGLIEGLLGVMEPSALVPMFCMRTIGWSTAG